MDELKCPVCKLRHDSCSSCGWMQATPLEFRAAGKTECCEFFKIQACSQDGRVFKLCENHFKQINLAIPCSCIDKCSCEPADARKCGHDHQHGPDGCECRDSLRCCCDCHKRAHQTTEQEIRESKIVLGDSEKAVEALIGKIVSFWSKKPDALFDRKLRELVELARKP